MKRLFTFVICLTLSQITKTSYANNLVPADSGFHASTVDQLKRDTNRLPIIVAAPMSIYQNNAVKKRLDSIQKEVPLIYNEYVQSYVDLYTAPGRRDDIGRIIGLSKYYFPIYEKAFRDMGIPEEIKFLSIVESELNPNAVSRVGATGPWQFMYATGKVYGLSIDDYVDERRDPIQASYAAAAYLKDAYQEFGDWLLAIASYNCGKSNVERAIDKAGVNDFWAIRQYLPIETRGYVPAYIAMSYVMNCFNKHGITAQACAFNTQTDTVLVNKPVSLNNIAGVLGISIRDLSLLNPSYKRLIVNATATAPRRIIIPQVPKDKYAVLYEALNAGGGVAYPQPAYAYVPPAPDKRAAARPSFHKVKRGESLDDISDRYGVEVDDLKTWNKLGSKRPAAGTRLRLTEPDEKAESSTEKPNLSSQSFITYKVRQGDTLAVIADKFSGATVEKIKSLNRLKKDALQPGMMLKISKG